MLRSAPLELSVCCWLTAFVCGLMGLMVSAFVSSSAQVMPVLVVAIMGQIVMAGGLIDISGKNVLLLQGRQSGKMRTIFLDLMGQVDPFFLM